MLQLGAAPHMQSRVMALYMTTFIGYAESQMKAGKSADEAATAYTVPEQFKGYTAPPARVKPDMQVIYNELTK
jgi:hypothetical protein